MKTFDLPAPHIPSGLPPPDDTARAHGEHVTQHLIQAIGHAQGFLPFDAWMQEALYAPGLGYYSAGSAKLHAAGDFTTAPEISPLFGQALARQVADVLGACGSTQVLEFGAGTGALAASVLAALQQQGLHADYAILEISPDLRTRQKARLASWGERVRWLDAPPDAFRGCVLANEVLDAMPATLFKLNAHGEPQELGVVLASASEQGTTSPAPAEPSDARQPDPLPFRWASRPLDAGRAALVASRLPAPWPGYQSEMNPQAEAWVRDLGHWLQQGAALLIDYGFPRAEYYHPQRHQGTLMCHFRHHAHDQALILPGLQDITTHVDFTAMADAALEGGLDVLGYTSQARFLLNLGLTDLLPRSHAPDPTVRAQQMAALNTLLSEAEMGELFKVLAVGRGLTPPLRGFVRGDRRDRL